MSRYNTDPAASQGYEFNVTISYELEFYNHSASDVEIRLGTFPSGATFTPYVKALNASFQGTNANLTPFTLNPFDYLASGSNTFGSYSNVVITSPSGYINTGDLLTIATGITSNWQPTNKWYDVSTGLVAQVDVNINITDIRVEITPNSNTQPIGGFVTMNEYVPQKVKQSDFVKSIFTMYNLFADVDPEQPNNIILTPIVTGKQIGRAHV